MTALCLGRAASIARPDKVVGIRVEVDDLRSEGVWWSRGFGSVPCSSAVGCVEEDFVVGDEVGTIVRVFMVVECKEAVFRVDLRLAVTVVAGLPGCAPLVQRIPLEHLRALHTRIRQLHLPEQMFLKRRNDETICVAEAT